MDNKRRQNVANISKLPLMIFTFSDPSEKSQTFFNKIFNKAIQNSPWFKTLALNPPIDKDIDRVLKGIISVEGIDKRHLAESKL